MLHLKDAQSLKIDVTLELGYTIPTKLMLHFNQDTQSLKMNVTLELGYTIPKN